jgi:hypothetical protein
MHLSSHASKINDASNKGNVDVNGFHSVVGNRAEMYTGDHGIPQHLDREFHEENNGTTAKSINLRADCQELLLLWQQYYI